MGEKWYCFCFRNYRLNFGKIDPSEGEKKLGLRKQIRYINKVHITTELLLEAS